MEFQALRASSAETNNLPLWDISYSLKGLTWRVCAQQMQTLHFLQFCAQLPQQKTLALRKKLPDLLTSTVHHQGNQVHHRLLQNQLL